MGGRYGQKPVVGSLILLDSYGAGLQTLSGSLRWQEKEKGNGLRHLDCHDLSITFSSVIPKGSFRPDWLNLKCWIPPAHPHYVSPHHVWCILYFKCNYPSDRSKELRPQRFYVKLFIKQGKNECYIGSLRSQNYKAIAPATVQFSNLLIGAVKASTFLYFLDFPPGVGGSSPHSDAAHSSLSLFKRCCCCRIEKSA